MSVIPRLRDFPCIQIEDAAPEAWEIILDLKIFNWLVFGEHFFHQMPKRRHVPLVLAQFGNAPPMGLSLSTSEYRQERLARGHDCHVVFEHNQRIADRVNNTLSQLPIALALFSGGAFFAYILDSK